MYLTIEVEGGDNVIIIINPDNMEIIEEYKTTYMPISLEVSDDGSFWYITKSNSEQGNDYLLKKINSYTKNTLMEVEVVTTNMLYSQIFCNTPQNLYHLLS